VNLNDRFFQDSPTGARDFSEMAILVGNGARGSKHYAFDERRAEVTRTIYCRALCEKGFASDNVGNFDRHE
jgi:hypothetical protein